MIALVKALLPGIFLTLLVALFLGSGGASGGMLAVEPFRIDVPQMGVNARLYWSWPLFLGGTGLIWIVFLIMED